MDFRPYIDYQPYQCLTLITIFLFPPGGCIWVLFGCEKCDTAQYEIFPIAVLLGAGGSAMLINCLAIVANLIGSNIGTK